MIMEHIIFVRLMASRSIGLLTVCLRLNPFGGGDDEPTPSIYEVKAGSCFVTQASFYAGFLSASFGNHAVG